MWSVHMHKLSVYFWLMFVLSSPDIVCSCGEDMSGRKGELKTPNYPSNYDNNLNCTWTIKVDTHDTITVVFVGIDVEEPDYFNVYDGPSTSSTILRHICGYRQQKPIISSGNSLTFTLITDNTINGTVSDKLTLHTNPVSWSDANTACLKEDGYLAVQSELSEPLLTRLLTNISDSVWFGDYLTPWVWLKGCYRDKNGNFIPDKDYSESKHNFLQACQFRCQDSIYFGLQGRKCLCLTSEDMDHLILSRQEQECKIICPGDSDWRCGGKSALTVFMNENANLEDETVEDKLCRVYWTNDSRLFHQQKSCSHNESFACFKDEQGFDVNVVNISTDFYTAALRGCKGSYGLADYKLFSYLKETAEVKNAGLQYWVGSFRKEGNTKEKDSTPKPSSCKTIRHQENEYLIETQPSCELQFGFVCQKEAIRCGEKLYTENGYVSWPVNQIQYDNNENCQWEITVSEGRSITMTFLNVSLEASNHCSYDFIEVSESLATEYKRLDRLCGSASNITVSSSSNAVRIRFKSDSDTCDRGFQLKWWSELKPITTMTTPVQSSKPDVTSTLHISQSVSNLDDDTTYSLEGGAIAGIVAGGVFIIIVVVIALAVLIRRHRKSVNYRQEPIELQRSIRTYDNTALSDTNPDAVYSKPVAKESRKSKGHSLGEQPSGDLYYDHLNQGLKTNASQHGMNNTYDKLPTGDIYDHTTQAATSVMGEEYEHLDNKKKGPRLTGSSEYNSFESTIKQPVKGGDDYDYFVQETAKVDN